MKKIHINVSKPYDVIIGKDLLKNTGEYAKKVLKGNKILIVTDDIVEKLYLEYVKNSVSQNGYIVETYTIKNGEQSKNSDEFLKILNFLAEKHFTRSDALIALGGGVVGDLTGFCASVYLRGISFIQIPTTLLASVDSSVGGKTAIDLSAGKNLAGSFYHPELVLCDLNTFRTLKDSVFSDGMAEVIKYGVIYDAELFERLKEKKIDEEIIGRCVEIKRDVVVEDEFESGLRKILNFGHTIGHAIEKCSNYKLTHGTGVAIGMAMITKYAVIKEITSKKCYEELMKIIKLYNLPLECDFSADELFNAATSDKKRDGDYINVILPLEIGKCSVKKITMNELKEIINSII